MAKSVERGESSASLLSESDITRQAELVVMEYLKSSRCSKTLDAMMSHGSSAQMSPTASEMYADDLERRKKAGANCVLEYVVSEMEKDVAAAEISRPPSPTVSRSIDINRKDRDMRRMSKDESGDEKSAVEWTREEVHQLKKAIKQTGDVDDKNERWRQIAACVGNGKTKKHCYLKYKELKEEKKSTSTIESRRGSLGEKGDERRRSSAKGSSKRSPAEVERNMGTENQLGMMIKAPTPLEKPSNRPRGEDLEVEDCEDFDSTITTAPRNPVPKSHGVKSAASSSVIGRIPSVEEVESLREILFPEDQRNFSSHWEEQGFFFSNRRDLRYGLVQNHGGPCGVLAVVQVYTLRYLLGIVRPSDWRNPVHHDQDQAMIVALSHILWQAARASQKPECTLVLNDESAKLSGSKKKFMSGMLVYTTKTLDQTKSLLSQHLGQFTAPKGNGLVLLVLSAVLTKGVETIVSEMDSVEGALGGGGKLIGGHDYCTQEIVNLLLTGVASSNVFNGNQLLEGSSEDDPKAVVLKGISARSDVGFLSLFEAYEYIVVGSHLKRPHFNVWVVCSESHYSVIFADPSLFTSDSIHDEQEQFDVFYFDGLGNQDEEIRLTVHAFAATDKIKQKANELIPPLNLVLQTKWPHARIDWNGVDPLL